jgi:hypothetical protein
VSLRDTVLNVCRCAPQVCAESPMHLDPHDNISVWAGYDTTLRWLLELPHILAALPPREQWHMHGITTLLTNDGTPLHGPPHPPPSLFPWPNSHFRSHSGTVGRTVGCTVCGAG